VSTVVALLGLAAVHWLAVMSPGPSTVLVVQTAAVSRRGGLIAAFAMMLGALLWAAAALYGLQALFAQFAWLYRVFQVAGGAFLIYLAVQIWRHAREPLPEIAPAAARVGDGQIFARALLLQLGNPKIMVFFGSIFLSVLPHDMPAWLQAVVLALVAFDEFTWFAVLALTFSGTTARAFYRRAKFWLDRFMGGALALLGLRLALSSR